MSEPIIFHDPTSEPSRAVHWLCLEAAIPVEIKYTWLTRGEHVTPDFLKVNPFHQVPAMKHGEFCLSEATAIMKYLTDIQDVSDVWFGADIKERAIVNKHLSWYHTNLRKIATLDYFLPVLLLPKYLGFELPSKAEVEAKQEAMAAMFSQLDEMLSSTDFLCGEQITAADILYASDIFALEVDPDYHALLEPYKNVVSWLARLKGRPACNESLKAWSHVVPHILSASVAEFGVEPSWVASKCEEVLA